MTRTIFVLALLLGMFSSAFGQGYPAFTPSRLRVSIPEAAFMAPPFAKFAKAGNTYVYDFVGQTFTQNGGEAIPFVGQPKVPTDSSNPWSVLSALFSAYKDVDTASVLALYTPETAPIMENLLQNPEMNPKWAALVSAYSECKALALIRQARNVDLRENFTAIISVKHVDNTTEVLHIPMQKTQNGFRILAGLFEDPRTLDIVQFLSIQPPGDLQVVSLPPFAGEAPISFFGSKLVQANTVVPIEAYMDRTMLHSGMVYAPVGSARCYGITSIGSGVTIAPIACSTTPLGVFSNGSNSNPVSYLNGDAQRRIDLNIPAIYVGKKLLLVVKAFAENEEWERQPFSGAHVLHVGVLPVSLQGPKLVQVNTVVPFEISTNASVMPAGVNEVSVNIRCFEITAIQQGSSTPIKISTNALPVFASQISEVSRDVAKGASAQVELKLPSSNAGKQMLLLLSGSGEDANGGEYQFSDAFVFTADL